MRVSLGKNLCCHARSNYIDISRQPISIFSYEVTDESLASLLKKAPTDEVKFLVHRNSREELDDACRQIENYFLRPAWVVRETERAHLAVGGGGS